MLIDQSAIRTGETWAVDAERLLVTQVPPTLTGVLQARLDSLPAPEKHALQQASMVGTVFWDQALAAVDAQAGQRFAHERMRARVGRAVAQLGQAPQAADYDIAELTELTELAEPAELRWRLLSVRGAERDHARGSSHGEPLRLRHRRRKPARPAASGALWRHQRLCDQSGLPAAKRYQRRRPAQHDGTGF